VKFRASLWRPDTAFPRKSSHHSIFPTGSARCGLGGELQWRRDFEAWEWERRRISKIAAADPAVLVTTGPRAHTAWPGGIRAAAGIEANWRCALFAANRLNKSQCDLLFSKIIYKLLLRRLLSKTAHLCGVEYWRLEEKRPAISRVDPNSTYADGPQDSPPWPAGRAAF
jgi:hypothetical protein